MTGAIVTGLLRVGIGRKPALIVRAEEPVRAGVGRLGPDDPKRIGIIRKELFRIPAPIILRGHIAKNVGRELPGCDANPHRQGVLRQGIDGNQVPHTSRVLGIRGFGGIEL